MKMDLVDKITKSQLRNDIPEFEAGEKEQSRKKDDQNDIGNVKIELIFAGGDHGLPQQAEVGRNERILSAFNFDQVDKRNQAEQQRGERSRPEKIPEDCEEKAEHGKDREQIQDQKQRFVQKVETGFPHWACLEPDA